MNVDLTTMDLSHSNVSSINLSYDDIGKREKAETFTVYTYAYVAEQ